MEKDIIKNDYPDCTLCRKPFNNLVNNCMYQCVKCKLSVAKSFYETYQPVRSSLQETPTAKRVPSEYQGNNRQALRVNSEC